jgi:hypothetical protein
MYYGTTAINCRILNTATNGAYVTYTVDIPDGVAFTKALAWASTGSATSVNISVDGTVVKNVSLQVATPAWKEIHIPVSPGTHTITFTTAVSGYMSIGGVNMIELKDYKKGYNFDQLVVNHETESNYYITNGGSIDYALLDADTDLFCGSYHGGETKRSEPIFLLDGEAITLTDGQIHVGNVFEIEQATNIVGKINTNSRHIFRCDGMAEFEVYFDGDINLKELFTNMTTTHTDYTLVTYPVYVDTTADGFYYLPLGCDYVVQKNPTNNQKIITIMNDNMVGGKSITPYIATSEYYNKLYKDNIGSDTGVNFTGGNFKVVHIFE